MLHEFVIEVQARVKRKYVIVTSLDQLKNRIARIRQQERNASQIHAGVHDGETYWLTPPKITQTANLSHRKSANAEDCPACSPSDNLPYPFVCPGDDRYKTQPVTVDVDTEDVIEEDDTPDSAVEATLTHLITYMLQEGNTPEEIAHEVVDSISKTSSHSQSGQSFFEQHKEAIQSLRHDLLPGPFQKIGGWAHALPADVKERIISLIK